MQEITVVHQRLCQSFSAGVTLPISFRIEQLRRIRQFLVDTEEEHLASLYADLHKSRLEALTYDLSPVHGDLAYFIRNLKRISRPKYQSRTFLAPVYTEKHPKGVVLVIGAFNFPTNLLIRPLIAAIAAGNAVCLKPSELAPACEAFVRKLLNVLDDRIFAIVTGPADVAASLTMLKWDHIMFTGSSRVGRLVMEAAARNLTPVTLELGGKNPVIVHNSAHISTAARIIVRGRFLNCGQFCLASDYCLVEETVYDQFVSEVLKHVVAAYTDKPKECEYYGRLISSDHWKRVVQMLTETKGKVLIGGEHDDDAQHYLAPTVVEVDNENDSLMKEEIFGPILPIMRVKSVDEALQIVNRRDQSLAMYVFCQDRRIREKVINSTRSGSVGVNEVILQVASHGSFLGGVGESGIGAYGFERGYEEFSHTRPVMYSRPMYGRMLCTLSANYFAEAKAKCLVPFLRMYSHIPFPGKMGLGRRIGGLLKAGLVVSAGMATAIVWKKNHEA